VLPSSGDSFSFNRIRFPPACILFSLNQPLRQYRGVSKCFSEESLGVLYQRVDTVAEQLKLENIDTTYRKQDGENTRQGDCPRSLERRSELQLCFYTCMDYPDTRLLSFFTRIQL
jgi:hypothetical protein